MNLSAHKPVFARAYTNANEILVKSSVITAFPYSAKQLIREQTGIPCRTYTTIELPEKVAFLGVPKHSIVSVGTYGCVKTKEDKFYFREGLTAMLKELEPEVVLVYGSMPHQIFDGLENRTRFVRYPDWISAQKAGEC